MQQANLDSLQNEGEKPRNAVLFYRLGVPFLTTSLGQVISGAFLGVKADMQNNPNLGMRAAFQTRYGIDNEAGKVLKGISNLYKGNFWNYTYTLICSLTGNNLVQWVKTGREGVTEGIFNAALGGVAAGCLEASWAAPLVARELNKTTASTLPSLRHTYTKLYPSLAFRDSVGWVVVQVGTTLIEDRDSRIQKLSSTEKAIWFVATGMLAALISSPADANLRRLYSEKLGRGPVQIFGESCQKYGISKTLTAGWKGRLAVVSPPYIAYAVAQSVLEKGLADRSSVSTRAP